MIKISLEKIEEMASLGLTQDQIASLLDISTYTITNYNKKWPAFFKALKRGKDKADSEVVKSLYKRANGYEIKETTIEYIKIGLEQTPAEKTKVVTKYICPDTTAQIFWLKNRRPQEWRDKTEIDHTMKEYLLEDYNDKTPEDLEKIADDLRAKRITGRNKSREGTGLQEKG